MNKDHEKLDRLLRSAALAGEAAPAAPPFGFEMRIVALWRSGANKPNGVANLLRRVSLLSGGIAVVAALAAFHELQQSHKLGESLSNEFAIADSAIENEFGK